MFSSGSPSRRPQSESCHRHLDEFEVCFHSAGVGENFGQDVT